MLFRSGHCKARLGRFAEAAQHFTQAVTLAPDRIGYQRDLAMARLALDDRAGYRKVCARMIELAEKASADREAAQMTALTCVLDVNTVPKWDVGGWLVAPATLRPGSPMLDQGDLVGWLISCGRVERGVYTPR